MRFTNLPQPVAVRLLDIDARVGDLVTEANRLEASVKVARDVIGGKIDNGPEVFEQTRAGFATIYAEANAARQRADNEFGMLQDIKSWIEGLPHNTKLCVVPSNGDHDLATLEAKLAAMRSELQQLTSITVPADNIASKVKDYVHTLATKAEPLLRGYGPGQTLEVLWPTGPDCNRRNGNGFSTIDGNALYLAALLQPEALASAIVKAIADTQPMPKAELEKRRSVLPNEIDELSYTVATLREKAGVPPDPSIAPWHWLGVRAKEEERQQIRA